MNFRNFLICVFSFLAVSPVVHATTLVENAHHLRITLYAPDWIWQGQNINVLVVAEHDGQSSTELYTHLFLPKGREHHFAYEEEASQRISIEDGERQRIAFTNITALDGHPRQSYEFEFAASDPRMDSGLEIRIPFQVRTIQGPVINEGMWAAILPAGLAAAWCFVIALYLSRHSAPGAWKTPSEPMFGGDPPKNS